MDEIRRFDRLAFHGSVVEYLPKALKSEAAALESVVTKDTGLSLVVARAAEILSRAPWNLPPWVDTETQYLVVLDVPEQTIPRLATVLRLHKPDQRLHISRDPGVVKRTVITLSRSGPWEGIVDAYVISDLLCVLLGDMTEREFPKKELPGLRNVSQQVFRHFTIDSAGSFLHWPDLDLHMGPSQMLQAVDPAYLADVEIERYAMENVSQALYEMRVDRGLRQTDIEGLSDRHVRRLENEQTRLSVGAAETYARVFGQDLGEFLDELSERVTALRVSQGSTA
jgi:hypothetical protein